MAKAEAVDRSDEWKKSDSEHELKDFQETA
jgi:hypothetical protein